MVLWRLARGERVVEQRARGGKRGVRRDDRGVTSPPPAPSLLPQKRRPEATNATTNLRTRPRRTSRSPAARSRCRRSPPAREARRRAVAAPTVTVGRSGEARRSLERDDTARVVTVRDHPHLREAIDERARDARDVADAARARDETWRGRETEKSQQRGESSPRRVQLREAISDAVQGTGVENPSIPSLAVAQRERARRRERGDAAGVRVDLEGPEDGIYSFTLSLTEGGNPYTRVHPRRPRGVGRWRLLFDSIVAEATLRHARTRLRARWSPTSSRATPALTSTPIPTTRRGLSRSRPLLRLRAAPSSHVPHHRWRGDAVDQSAASREKRCMSMVCGQVGNRFFVQ